MIGPLRRLLVLGRLPPSFDPLRELHLSSCPLPHLLPFSPRQQGVDFILDLIFQVAHRISFYYFRPHFRSSGWVGPASRASDGP